MKLMTTPCGQKRWRAPVESGGTLIDPAPGAVADAVEQNAATISAADYDCSGRTLAELASAARGELVSAAWEYTRRYRDVARPEPASLSRVFVAGHQPQLFHPGVWFKNFVLGALAARHGGVAVNLAIDSDTIKSAALRVPTGLPQDPRVENVLFDRQTAEIPYEERTIIDRDCLASFGARAAQTIEPLVADPLVREFWPLVLRRAAESDNLGRVIAEARHQQEGLWGNTTLEIPQSGVCSLPAFHWFTCHLLAQLPRLWDEYNRAVGDYRRVNHVRSTAHPVPDLAIEGDWLEAPYWIWTADNPLRRRLFVRQLRGRLLLSDRGGVEHELSLDVDTGAASAAEQLAELARRGVRLRTRALITTLFARLCLGDLFLHGIGGAKYDCVTDLLIRRFFGMPAPAFMTLTATQRLPVPGTGVSSDDARRIESQLRELAYHPERHLPPGTDGAVERLVASKRHWIETSPTRENARRRGEAIREVNAALQPWLDGTRARLLQERGETAGLLRTQAILASREYAFCLYPAESLERLMDTGVQAVHGA